jgi:imidazolonepropionase-like amidohydrolase
MALALVDGRVVVGDGRVFEKAGVLVEGERIVRVAAKGLKAPKSARRIPLSGCTLLPGFIDAHVHLCMDASADPIAASVQEPPAVTALKAASHARATLRAGVTTVRDMGGREGIDLGLKQAIRMGLVPGPRMLASGRLICMTGGHGWQIGCEADGADAVRRAARQQIKAGADIVKLMATGGVLTPGVEPGSEQFTQAELAAGIEEAHKAGKRTATHAMGTRGILNALRAGIDSIEHGVYLDEEAVALMKRRGVPLVPTIAALHHIEARGLAAGIPAFAVEKTARVKPHHLASLRMAHAAGLAVAAGTDAGTPFNRHGENLLEIKLLVDCGGFSPAAAIEAGTRVAAQVLGLERELGTIEEGKLADLVLVAGNPLEEIGRLTDPEAIRLVVQGGRIVAERQS